MTAIVRSFAVTLALSAMLLRAVLPAGWMPNLTGAGDAPLVICSVDGAHHLPSHDPAHGETTIICVRSRPWPIWRRRNWRLRFRSLSPSRGLRRISESRLRPRIRTIPGTRRGDRPFPFEQP